MSNTNHFHYQEIEKLVEHNVFSVYFYSYYFNKTFLDNNKKLLENRIYTYLFKDLYREIFPGDLEENRILKNEDFDHFDWEDGKVILQKLKGKNISDKTQIKKYIKKYIESSKKFVEKLDKRCNKVDKAKFIYILYGWNDIQDSFGYDVLNYILQLFNQFCLSLLKGEYIIKDDFSETLINIEDKLQPRAVLEIIQRYGEEERAVVPEEETNSLEEKDIINRIQKRIDWLETSEADVRETLTYVLWQYQEDCYFEYYNDFLNICHEYFIFNRQIDTFIDVDFKTKKIQYNFGLESKYETDLTEVYNGFFTPEFSPVNVPLRISKILPCLFRRMLDMCLIDHNFISSEDNFKKLLKLEELLWGPPIGETDQRIEEGRPSNCFLGVLTDLQKDENISKNVLKELSKTMQLVDYKNKMLIYKIIKRAGDEIKLYEYIGLKHVLIFADQENKRKFHWRKGLKDYKILGEEKNELLRENTCFYIRKSEKNLFNKYEKIYLSILSNDYDYQEYLKDYRKLEEKMSERNSIFLENHHDIRKYNATILVNLVQQFIHYGIYIKELKLLVKQKEADLYLNKVLNCLKKQEGAEVLSCSFIREHIKWGLGMLKERSEQEKGDLTFNYITLVNRLLQLFERLIDHITTDHYCMNFSPLFQDCFYKCTFSNQLSDVGGHEVFAITAVKRVNENGVHLGKGIKNKDIVFVSSSWQPPVNIYQLKKEYREWKEQLELLSTEFYNNYFKQVLQGRLGSELQRMEDVIKERENSLTGWIKQELDDNKRSMVQILGIFAAFLALATISLGSFLHMQGYKDYLKVMFSLTICLGVFIVLLHFVVNRRYNKPFMNLVSLLIILLTVLFLGGLLVFWR